MALVPRTDMERMRAGLRRFASGFTAGQKAVTIAALGFVILIVVVFVLLSGKPTYSVLFSNLQAQDAASITSQLQSDRVPYELQDGGATILVPSNDVDQARLTAAAAGLPSQGTVGLSLLTKSSLTTSQLTQQADYLQAIQGELEQTIDGVQGVESSQVNVAEPANQTFALANTAPTGASVLVTMSQGHSLTQSQVQAIVHLVASSVPGLSAGSVTVADNDGDLLAGPGVNASDSSSNATASYDTAVQAKVEAYLTSILGPNNADVQVGATLNFNKVKTTTHQLATSVKGAPSSFCTQTTTTTTTYDGKGAAAGGAAGSITAATTTGTGKYSQVKKSRTCETGTQTTTVTQATGTVVRQSVAVLVNKNAVPKGTTLAAIKKGVSAAAEIDKARGDVLAFTVAPFSTQASKQAAAAAQATQASSKQAKLEDLGKDGVAVLAVLALLVLLGLSARRRRVHAAHEPAVLIPASPAALGPPESPTLEIPRIEGAGRPIAEIEHFIDRQPEETAQLLRSLLRREALPEGAPR